MGVVTVRGRIVVTRVHVKRQYSSSTIHPSWFFSYWTGPLLWWSIIERALVVHSSFVEGTESSEMVFDNNRNDYNGNTMNRFAVVHRGGTGHEQ